MTPIVSPSDLSLVGVDVDVGLVAPRCRPRHRLRSPLPSSSSSEGDAARRAGQVAASLLSPRPADSAVLRLLIRFSHSLTES